MVYTRRQRRDQQGKDFIDKRKEDNYMLKLREQESEIKKEKETQRERERIATRHNERKRGNNARVFET